MRRSADYFTLSYWLEMLGATVLYGLNFSLRWGDLGFDEHPHLPFSVKSETDGTHPPLLRVLLNEADAPHTLRNWGSSAADLCRLLEYVLARLIADSAQLELPDIDGTEPGSPDEGDVLFFTRFWAAYRRDLTDEGLLWSSKEHGTPATGHATASRAHLLDLTRLYLSMRPDLAAALKLGLASCEAATSDKAIAAALQQTAFAFFQALGVSASPLKAQNNPGRAGEVFVWTDKLKEGVALRVQDNSFSDDLSWMDDSPLYGSALTNTLWTMLNLIIDHRVDLGLTS